MRGEVYKERSTRMDPGGGKPCAAGNEKVRADWRQETS